MAEVFQDKNGGRERDHRTDSFKTIGQEWEIIYTETRIVQVPQIPKYTTRTGG